MFCWAVRLRGTETADQAAVTVRHCVYCFGGDRCGKEKQIDVHVFNTVTLTWRKLIPVTPGRVGRHLEVPTRLYGYTVVLIEDTVYLWGGCEYYADRYHSVLYAFDVDVHTWFKPPVSGTVPEKRSFHSACVLGKVMYIHGGWTPTGHTNDTYMLDTKTMVWTLINTRVTEPPVSCRHSATIIGTKMFVFGGLESEHINTIRVFDTETNHWRSTPSAQIFPEGPCDHSAFTYNGELYILAGLSREGNLNAVWKFSPDTFSWKTVEPKGKGPYRLYPYRMFCCMVGDRITLFRGDNTRDGLYVLDLSPSLKTLCTLTVIQYGLDQSGLPHNIRWELAATTSNSS